MPSADDAILPRRPRCSNTIQYRPLRTLVSPRHEPSMNTEISSNVLRCDGGRGILFRGLPLRLAWILTGAAVLGLFACLQLACSNSGTAPAAALKGQWVHLSQPANTPSPRAGSAVVHDPASGTLLLFGGQFQSSQSMMESYNDLWSYTPGANTWTQLNPSGVLPPPRGFASMTYDPDHKVILLYGGVGVTTPFRSNMPTVSELTDLWAYDPAANTWTKETPDGASPPFRRGEP